MKLTVPLEVSKTVAYGDDEFDVIVRQPMQREYLQREELWERAQEEKRLFWGYIQAWDVYFTLVPTCGSCCKDVLIGNPAVASTP